MRIITRNSDNVVVIYSAEGSPSADDGHVAYDLTDEQAASFDAMLSQPNGGITFDGTTFASLPAPAPPKPVVGASPAQFREELRDMGKLDAVKALIAQQDERTQDRFEYATEFRSDSPLLLALASDPSIGMSEQDVFDALTRAAARDIGS